MPGKHGVRKPSHRVPWTHWSNFLEQKEHGQMFQALGYFSIVSAEV